MADPPQTPDPDATSDRASPPHMPRWVKIPAIVIGVLIVLFAVLQFTGLSGEHGPGRHGPGQDQQVHDPSKWRH